jgi:hypothetical protein
MDKKIISLSFILLILIGVTVAYIAINQPSSTEINDSYGQEDGDITDDEIFNEVDDSFEPEDYEIDLGDMV